MSGSPAVLELSGKRYIVVEEGAYQEMHEAWERAKISPRIPTHEELVALARSHPPPQSWFNDTDDPTQPEEVQKL